MALEHFGAIDIGTNAARLFIGYVQSKKGNAYVKKVSLIRVPLRLGEDVFSTGEISAKKLERFEETMRAFYHLMAAFEVKGYRACATSAMREASNSVYVRELLKERTGVDIEVIDGEEEANIIFSNFFTGDYDKSKSYLFIDVGGGSTELTVLRNGERVKSRSFELGTLRILKNKVQPAIWDELFEWVHDAVGEHGEMEAIGSGGNINKVFKLLEKRSGEVVHSYELESMSRFLNAMSVDERIDRLRLKPDRADVIAPATHIYLSVMQQAGIDRMLVPKTGLADALVYQQYMAYQPV
jgi:exopolyphosphatase/guanosine-5'-triphosphate,3'-diphosphate pyrophosphatase